MPIKKRARVTFEDVCGLHPGLDELVQRAKDPAVREVIKRKFGIASAHLGRGPTPGKLIEKTLDFLLEEFFKRPAREKIRADEETAGTCRGEDGDDEVVDTPTANDSRQARTTPVRKEAKEPNPGGSKGQQPPMELEGGEENGGILPTPTKVCRFFKNGSCKFGIDCRFAHPQICPIFAKHGPHRESNPKGCKRPCQLLHADFKWCKKALRSNKCHDTRCGSEHFGGVNRKQREQGEPFQPNKGQQRRGTNTPTPIHLEGIHKRGRQWASAQNNTQNQIHSQHWSQDRAQAWTGTERQTRLEPAGRPFFRTWQGICPQRAIRNTTGGNAQASQGRQQLNLLTLNVNCSKVNRSVFHLQEDILDLIKRASRPSVISLTEVDIPNKTLAEQFNIPGYTTFVSPHTEEKVRTILLVGEDLKAEQASKKTDLPSVSAKVELPDQKSVVITSVYRQWSAPDAMKELDDLNDILEGSKNSIVLGDFNIDPNRLNDKTYAHRNLLQNLHDICEAFNMVINHEGPTFQHSKGSSTLDFFLVGKELSGGARCGVVEFGNSDHDAAAMDVGIKLIKETSAPKMIRRRTKICEPKRYKRDLQDSMKELGAKLWQSDNVDTMAREFVQTFNGVLDKHAPVRMVKIQPKKENPVSQETLKVMRERNYARNNLMKASPQERKIKIEIFKRLRNRVSSMLKRDRAIRAQEDLSEGINPYKVANKLLGKQKKSHLDDLIRIEGSEEGAAKTLNNHFISKIDKLKEKLPSDKRDDPLSKIKGIKGTKACFDFQMVSSEQVEKIIKKMKKSQSHGPDGITSKQLKEQSEVIAPVLSLIINTSLQTGTYPRVFKEAWITPIFKNKGSYLEPGNYRPISNLSTIGKVLEIAACIQMTKYCEENGIFGTHQHGFRAGRSTSTALISSLIRWQNSKERGHISGSLMFDLSAAYDTLDPKILTNKANLYGFDKTPCNWIGSFLENRVQRVKIANSISTLAQLKYGIPQGSPLSCMLFLIYIADMPKWTTHSQIQGYADDTLLSTSGERLEDVVQQLQEDAGRLLNFFAANQLVANPDKTSFLVFRPKQTSHRPLQISVGTAQIHESNCEKILGVQIQNDLSWDTHVSSLMKKMNHGLATMKQVKGILPTKTMKTLMEGLIMSHVRYCMDVYLTGELQISQNEPASALIKKLQIKQNDAMRLLLNKKRSELISRDELLKKCELHSINQIGATSTLQAVTRLLQTNPEASEFFMMDHSARRGPTIRTSKEPRSFVSKSAKLWNQTSLQFRSGELTKTKSKKAILEVMAKIPKFS